MMFYISTMFRENVSKETIFVLKLSKGHNSVKNVAGVTVFVFCILHDDALYLYQVLCKYLKEFQSYGADTICHRQTDRQLWG